MPSVSGVIAYDSTNLYTYPNAIPAGRIQSGVPVVLQNISTGVGLVALTDAVGAFSFGTVPAGNYILVEAWGTSGGVISPADFSLATTISTPTPKDPPISKAPSPPATATRLQSLTRNTITLTVSTTNVTNQNFVDAPIIEAPITLRQSSLIGNNLITAAQTGEWGTLPQGAANQTIPAIAPYPANVPSLTYFTTPSSVGNQGGAYNATNIAYSGIYNNYFWSMANHTTFDERSRMMVINAAGLGPAANERFFATTIPVVPNNYYIGFAWIANLLNFAGYVTPQVGVKVSTTSGTVIFNSPTPQLVYSNPPKWVQIGGVFNTGNNTVVNIEYQSLASGVNGNDYVADDFSIYQLEITPFLNSSKVVEKPIAKVGDILTYTIVLNNTGTITAETVQFQDTIPAGTSFLSNSVYVNGVNQSTFNPSSGFNIGGIKSGTLATISFKVNVVSVPSTGQAINNSTTTYYFSPVLGGVTIPISTFSNAVQTDIVNTTLTKSVSNIYQAATTSITYTLVYNNLSAITANNIVLIDTIPSGSTFVSDSLYVNGIPLSGSPNPPGINLPSVPPNSSMVMSFDVITPSSITQSPLKNSGLIKSVFQTTLGNSYTMSVNSNITTTTIVSAILSSSKIVNKNYANIGDILTYTIPIINTGNTTAYNIVIIDTIPNGTTFIPNTLKQDNMIISGSLNTPGVTLPNALKANSLSTITFQVQVVTYPNPNPIPNEATFKYTYTIDSTTTPNITKTLGTSTNKVTTQINNANLGNIKKLVDKSYADCGDVLTYTIIIPNTGTVTAQDVIFRDTIPNGTTLVPNSVFVNRNLQIAANPTIGITIPNIAPGASASVQFSVRVTCN